ncbi:hypothetical protein MUK70_10050 [Dyadobacter chenwenxiniae]|uniref:Uncharacterized protein n=1 Tax=Dyadobacter chenwenxiniae TaxID=2906456 RepID=A0A9X1PLX9_9BACT|nr:hypothetical protein [Dyadobacter chenwenxiniae]MCF0063293.1 hypothetical protein [Dyadobacter chenwenxiniae]UON85327.1 hypothetical protein MUK70_10050 [Dyadobacter chenwenxiniae]
MDKKSLVKSINDVFNAERVNGLHIDQFGLAPAYRGLSSNSFTLGVSAPSLVNEESSSRKTRIIFDALYKGLNDAEKMAIDRVRVYNNIDELKASSFYDFESFDSSYIECDFIPDLHSVA